MSSSVTVTHGSGQYQVIVAPGSLSTLSQLLGELAPGRRPVVITDSTVERFVSSGIDAPVLTVPAGEKSKTRQKWSALSDRMLELQFGRDSVVVAIGGGVVGDLAGFVAATYLRGIPIIQVPTSLLSMVDASVGGKTGVNTSFGKNLIGAFHPPLAVVADPLVIRSLPTRHLRNGLIEAVKHGLIADRHYYQWIEDQRRQLIARDPTTLATLVRRSVEIKAEVVAADERETGRRAILNAGHTVAHAIERVSSYRMAHGEAVAIGLVVEGYLSELLGHAPSGQADELGHRLRRLGLGMTLGAEYSDEALLAAMRHDKKTKLAAIHCALIGPVGELAWGAGPWTVAVDEKALRTALGRFRNATC